MSRTTCGSFTGRSEPEAGPGRSAGGLDQLHEHAVARTRVDEGDRSFRPAARSAVDQLESVQLETQERLREVRDLEADVVEALALAREKAGDAGRVVRRLDELDLGLADREEGDPDAVLGDVHHGLELE